MVITSKKTVFDETFDVFKDFIALEQEKEQLERACAAGSSPEVVERYQQLLEKLSFFDKSAALARVKMVLEGLGLMII